MPKKGATQQGAPEPKAKTDWESIEREYRAGQMSNVDIAARYNVSEGAVRKKAKALGWQKDLSGKVQKALQAALVRDTVRDSNAHRTESEIIQAAVVRGVDVVHSHRKDIASGRGIVSLLMSQLTDVAGKRSEFEEAIEIECAEDKNTKRRTALMKAVSIPAHASTVRDLSTAMKNLITLERQAFNIKDETEPDPAAGVAALLAQINGTALPIVKGNDVDE